ncbi:lipid A deacylase LpxR family protein [Mucilaginibacter paludis]|uniref:Lipid A deacylase LpxR family protein n=1 Tax=Mucilaginibacter paludis DSM 18603 TaxID=714943 RepID=H1Y7R7_9SPHI|nr:lipid A deacylase LpxR family protein [Mucilaginibacter paludis]EHQ29912.1 Protein of unknown function DUF2219 [Mucilaginibacter paludis DSM 18603]
MKFFPLFVISSVILLSTAFAQTKTYKNEAGFQTDNDGILAQGSDRYYTAGDFFFFHHALKINHPDSSKLENKVLGFEIGQKIFTPQTAFLDMPNAERYIDRPFAGYLYFGTTLNLLYKNESNLKLQGQLGFIGQYSYGKQIQEFIHRTLGFYKPAGWQYQVQNDFEVNLSAEYNRLLARGSSVDLTFNSNAALGTGFTNAGTGVTARFGKFNQLFNSISTGSTVSRSGKSKPLNDGEFFFYLKPSISFIAYNATIQGSMFEKQPGVNEIRGTKQPVMLSQQLGGDFVKGHWIIDLSAVFQTRETKEMVQAHQWGSVSGIYRF